MGTIYAIANNITGKVYVGQTKSEPALLRWKSHLTTLDALRRLGNHRHQSWTKLYRSLNKHGVENFSFIELVKVPEDKLDANEDFFIWFLDSVRNGYNIVERNSSPVYHRLTNEQKKKHAESLSKAWSSEGSFFRTDEYSSRQREGLKRAWADPNSGFNSLEAKRNRSKAQIGKKMSEDWVQNLKVRLKGNTYSRSKVSINGVIYDSCTLAAEALGVTNSTISLWIKNGKATKLTKDSK